MFNIFSDPYLEVAFGVGIGASLLTVVLLLFIIGLRLHRAWQTRHEQAFFARWNPVLMQAMMGDVDTPVPPLARRDRWLFLKLWNHFQESMRGEPVHRLGLIAYRLGCHQMAQRMLRRGNRAERLFALLTLGHMQDRSAWELLLAEIAKPQRASSLYAARALVQIDPPRAARILVPQLLVRDDWEMVRVAALLHNFRDVLGQELVQLLPQLPGSQQARALRLAEALQLQIDSALLLPWLQPDQSAELLIACLRLAAGAEVLPPVRALVGHADWRVRVQVARALGRLGQAQDVEALTRLLSDSQWWVRYRAAQALAGLPFLQREELRTLLLAQPDRYAREIAIQVLAEAEGTT